MVDGREVNGCSAVRVRVPVLTLLKVEENCRVDARVLMLKH